LSNELKFSDAFNKVFKKDKLNPSENGKTVMEEQYGFTIDSALIKEISSDNYTSYTFLIHREIADDSFFENLVVTLDSSSVPSAYIIKYNLNSDPIYINVDYAYSLDATTELTQIDYNASEAKIMYLGNDGCTIITLMCPYLEDHPAGAGCIAQDRGDLYYGYDSSGCAADPGGGGIGDGTPPDGGSPSGGTTGGNGGIYTDPNMPACKGPDCPEEFEEEPCPGDPVPNPEVAPQLNSGAKGALYGCTRYGDDGCDGDDTRNEKHNGLDIKNEYGNPNYAMFDGVVHSLYSQPGGAGYAIRIRSELPSGEIIIYQYFHMQKDNRLPEGTEVNAGDIVGYQGDSGNLKGAIDRGRVESHVHIKMNLYDGTGDSNNYTANFKSNQVNPADYMHTQIDNQGNSITQNCD
jgi:hypothetical protein